MNKWTKVYVSICMQVILSHLRSKAQTVLHNWCTTFVVSQNSHTIPTGHNQQQNKPSMTLDCNYYCCNHFVFWIYNVLLDLTWYFCNHIAVNEIIYAACRILSQSNQTGICSLLVTQNLVWHRLMKSSFSQHHPHLSALLRHIYLAMNN